LSLEAVDWKASLEKNKKCGCGVSKLMKCLLKNLAQIQSAEVPQCYSWNHGFFSALRLLRAIVTSRVARGCNCPHQFRKLYQKFSGQSSFRCVSQRNTSGQISPKMLGEPMYNLVVPDQRTMVHQLFMINQTLCTWTSENLSKGESIAEFSRWSQGFS